MKESYEELLSAWLRVSSQIRNDRFVHSMTSVEMHICNILYNEAEKGNNRVTATDICRETAILKSQAVKVLTDMEKKGIISRQVSPDDRRKFFITLTEEGMRRYAPEHENVLGILAALENKLGADRISVFCDVLNEIADGMQGIAP